MYAHKYLFMEVFARSSEERQNAGTAERKIVNAQRLTKSRLRTSVQLVFKARNRNIL